MFIDIKTIEKIRNNPESSVKFKDHESNIKIIIKTNNEELEKNIKNSANIISTIHDKTELDEKNEVKIKPLLDYKNIKEYNFINFYKSYINSIIFFGTPINIDNFKLYNNIFDYNYEKNLFS